VASYPIGYGRQTVSEDELVRRYAGKLHPEYWRRALAWIKSRDGKMGIGSAWRVTPHKVSAASRAGRSFHQDQRYASGFVGGAAIDVVARNGSNVHRAPHWDEVPKQGTNHPDIKRFGVHMNISSESWHLQAVEHDGWSSWANTGRPDPRPNYAIQGVSAPPSVPDVPAKAAGGGGSYTVRSGDSLWGIAQAHDISLADLLSLNGLSEPSSLISAGDVLRLLGTSPSSPSAPQPTPAFDPLHGHFGLWPVNPNKPTIRLGDDEDAVAYLQGVLKHKAKVDCDVDGQFGPQTNSLVRQVQGWNKITQNGVVDPTGTWPVVDQYAAK
jgi:LysM repeat protein